MIQFTVNADPQGKARPRMTRYGTTYTPKATRDYEALVKLCCWKAMGSHRKYEAGEPIEVTMNFFFPIPKSYTKKQREAIISGELQPTKKPDIDNCIKAILDAINGVAFEDDCQVLLITATKAYTVDEGRTEVKVMNTSENYDNDYDGNYLD